MTAQIPLTGSIGPSGPFAILGFSLPVITGNADHVLTEPEYSSTSLKVTSDGTSTGIKNVIAPLAQGMIFVVENATSEGFAIVLKGASGLGVTIPPNVTALVTSPDGVNFVAVGNGSSGMFVANLAALAAYPASGLQNGASLLVETLGAPFVLAATGSAAADGITVVTATDGRQWLRKAVPVAYANPLTAMFIDFQNAGGHASDENSGTSALLPLLTLAEFNRRVAYQEFSNLCTVTLTGDWNPATDMPLDLSTVRYVNNQAGSTSGSFVFKGTPVVSHTGTLTAGTTAINPATQQRQVLADTALAVNGWAAFEGLFCVIVGGARAGHSCVVVKHIAGGETAYASRPEAFTGTYGAAGPMVSGDAYQVQRGSNLGVGCARFLAWESAGYPPVVFQDVTFVSGNGYFSDMGFSLCVRCDLRTQGPLMFSTVNDLDLENCNVGQLDRVFSLVYMNAGTWSGAGDAQAVLCEGDCYITGPLLVTPNTQDGIQSFQVLTGTGSGAQIQDVTGDALTVVGTRCKIDALLWGNGNTGAGIRVGAGASVMVPGTESPAKVATVTGANDFTFSTPNNGAAATSANPWSTVTNAYAAPVATTWALFATSVVGGGFAENAHNPQLDAHLLGF